MQATVLSNWVQKVTGCCEQIASSNHVKRDCKSVLSQSLKAVSSSSQYLQLNLLKSFSHSLLLFIVNKWNFRNLAVWPNGQLNFTCLKKDEQDYKIFFISCWNVDYFISLYLLFTFACMIMQHHVHGEKEIHV